MTTQEIQTREENAMLQEGNNKWYLIGGLVVAGALGYWLWQRAQKKKDADADTDDGGPIVGPPEPPDDGDDPEGPTPMVPQAMPGLVPESAWNTTSEGTEKFPITPGKKYMGSVVVPVWASPDHGGNSTAASGEISDLQVTDVTPVPVPEGAPDHPAFTEWVRVRLSFQANGPGTIRLTKWIDELNVYSEEIYGPGGVGPVVRTLILEEA